MGRLYFGGVITDLPDTELIELALGVDQSSMQGDMHIVQMRIGEGDSMRVLRIPPNAELVMDFDDFALADEKLRLLE